MQEGQPVKTLVFQAGEWYKSKHHHLSFPEGDGIIEYAVPECDTFRALDSRRIGTGTLPGRPKQHKPETKWKFGIEMRTKRDAYENRI
jgi:hypothetical protein